MVDACSKSLKKAYSPLIKGMYAFLRLLVHACTMVKKHALKLSFSPLCGLVVFIDMNTTCMYLQKEAGVSKHY